MPANQFGIYDSRSFEGLWWLADTPENHIAGTMTYDPKEGARLNLIGMLRPLNEAFAAFNSLEPTRRLTIHGITTDGHKLTLEGCFSPRMHISAPGLATEAYRPRWVIVGDHFPKGALFTGCSIEMSMLEQWLGHRTVRHRVEEATRALSASFEPPQEQEFECPAIGCTISTSWRYSTTGDGAKTFGLKATSSLEMRSEVRASFPTWYERSTRLRNLAAICYGRPLSVLRLALFSPATASDGTTPQACSVLVQPPPFAREPLGDKKDDPIVSAESLFDVAPSAVNTWFTIYEELEPAMDLFFTVLLNRTLYSDVAFLLAAQAVEVLHRLMSPGGLVTNDEFCDVATVLAAAIPKGTSRDLRQKVLGMLKYANEPSLRQRLRESIRELKPGFGDTPLGITARDIHRIVNTRNYLTHYSPELAENALRDSDLYLAGRRLVLLLLVHILMRIGVPTNQIRKTIEQHSEFGQIMRHVGQ